MKRLVAAGAGVGLALGLAAAPAARAASEDQGDLSLEDLLKLKVTVASKTPFTERESPGIVTVVTRDEILKSGARDLSDVLRLVPGLSFGLDVYSAVGLAARGLWGNEGKILMLMDGLELNEPFFGTFHFGNHISVEQIQRIEVIRGPGSSIYGGYAELAVINIVTRSGRDLNGGQAVLTQGVMDHGGRRQNEDLAYGMAGKDWQVSIKAFAGDADRSDLSYTDLLGETYNFRHNSGIQTRELNFGLTYKGLNLVILQDSYEYNNLDGYGWNEPYQAHVLDKSLLMGAQYTFSFLRNKLTVTPLVKRLYYQPWYEPDQNLPDEFYNKDATRMVYGLVVDVQPVKMIDLLVGGEHWDDRAEASPDSEAAGLWWTDGNGNPTRFKTATTDAFYTQLLVRSFVNLTLGTRIERQTDYGRTDAPRVALTKVIGDFNFKLLYSEAFRSPSFENIRLDPGVRPEKTQVEEVELGYLLTKTQLLTMNLFQTVIKDPIVYTTTATGGASADAYVNTPQTGSRGGELVYRYREKKVQVNASYSYANTAGLNQTPEYAVPGRGEQLLAMPLQKAVLTASVEVVPNVTLTPTLLYMGESYGYDYSPNPADFDPTQDNGVGAYYRLQSFGPTLLADVNLRWRDLWTKGLDVDLAVHDMGNNGFDYVQAYDSYHPPIPGPSREVTGRVSYARKF